MIKAKNSSFDVSFYYIKHQLFLFVQRLFLKEKSANVKVVVSKVFLLGIKFRSSKRVLLHFGCKSTNAFENALRNLSYKNDLNCCTLLIIAFLNSVN